MPRLTVYKMTLDDLKIAIQWAIAEGWNIGKFDAEAYFAVDPKGFYKLHQDDQLIGFISVVKYANMGFVGFFIIKEEYRGQGNGAFLWKYAMEDFKNRLNNDDSCLGLYSVPKQIARYRKDQFDSTFTASRWNSKIPCIKHEPKTLRLSCNNHTLFQKVMDYDQSIFSADRTNFFEILLKLNVPGIQAFISLKKEKITGFGVIRPCQKGYRIGPLAADTLEDAKQLFEDLSNSIGEFEKEDEEIFLDMPSINKFTGLLAEYFNLVRMAENDTEMMFKQKPPKLLIENVEKNYAICSLELG